MKIFTFGEEKEVKKSAPTKELLEYLGLGFNRNDGKLPLFDDEGNWFSPETVETAHIEGWVEPAYEGQILKASKIMRLTDAGREVFEATATC